MTQGTIWNILGMIGLTPWTRGSFFSNFLVRVGWQHHGIPDGWAFMKLSGYGHKKQ